VVSFQDGKIEYMDVADAIKQRFVSPEDVALYESLGTSFGRLPVKAKVETVKVTGRPSRVY
jgi:6-phosphofructokinase 1